MEAIGMTKRFFTVFLPLILVMVMLLAVPVSAHDDVFDWTLEPGETFTLGSNRDTYVSSDTSVIEIRYGDTRCEAVAVGEGYADIYCTSNGNSITPKYRLYVTDFFFMVILYDIFGAAAETVFIVGLIVAIILAIISISYIFIDAPKHGVTRWWALLPIIINIVALGIYVIFRQENSKKALPNNVICPQCGSPQALGTIQCRNCGTRLR